jgi:adenylate cyclase
MFALLGEHWYFENDSFRVLYATLCSLNHAEASSSRRVVGGFGAMAVGLGIAGLHGSAQFYLNQAVAKAEQLGNPADIAYAQLLAGVYAAGKADWGAMNAALGRASELYHGLGDPFRWQQSRSILCFGALVRGEHQLAKGLLQEISLQASRMAFVQVQAWTWSARMALALAENADVSASLAAFEAVRSEALPVSERLLCTGLRAAAELRCGAVEAALASADAGLASMLKSPPTAWHIVPGVRGLAETYLSLLEDGRVAHPQRQELLRKARRACDAIARFAKASRACRPLALRLQARVLHLSGRPHRARPYAQRSLLAARELSLGLDERLAERELARLGAAPSLGEPRNHEENDG